MVIQIRHHWFRLRIIKSLLALSLSLAYLPSYADSLLNDGANQFIFNLDNDVLFGTDSEYTAGSHLLWSQQKIDANEWLFNPLFKPLRSHFSTQSGQMDQLMFATEIYTLRADNGSQVESVANTGWTYFAFRHIEAYGDQQLGMELNLGWIGPASGGEEIQNGVHSLIGNGKEEGWNHQYPNQPTLNLNVSLQNDIKALTGNNFHSFYTLSGQLGNFRTHVGGGLGVNYAQNCSPNFFDNQLNTLKFGKGWGWFVYSTVNVDYEIYNRLTDGRLMTDDKALVRRQQFWPLFDLGIGLTYHQFSMNYATKATPQYYENQPEKRFRYSSLNFHWGF